MHKFIDKFDCGNNCRINPRTQQPYEYMMDENNITATKCCIVTYDEAKIIQNKYHVMSVHFNNNEEKYGLKGAVFKDTNMLRKALEMINSKELK